jgi:NAD(P)H-quinone oxidoreductase subunit 4L
MTVGLEHYLILAVVLFCIGLYGVFSRRNAIIILMCIEIMLNAVNIALIAFARYMTPGALQGQVFALFVIAVAAAEAAVGIAIIITIYRKRGTVNVDNFDIMKW